MIERSARGIGKSSECLAIDENGSDGAKIYLYPGITLHYCAADSGICPIRHRHRSMENRLEISYCRSGQMEWRMSGENRIFLNPGDFSLHTMDICTDSVITFPSGHYVGLTITVDLVQAAENPPEILRNTDVSAAQLATKFCGGGTVAFLAANEQTESIFSAFFGQPAELRLPYQRLKVLELLLYLTKLEFTTENLLASYRAEQIEVVRRVHDELTQHIGERITIEALAKQYLINSTTLKSAFKAVYGNSIAAHRKEHRMEQSAHLLRESEESIAQIAQIVGYDSQSKFTAAFKAYFGVLPREYRKNRNQG